MRKAKRGIYSAVVVLLLCSTSGCSGARVGTSAGVDVVWGSNGPRVRPHVSIDVFNGGRW